MSPRFSQSFTQLGKREDGLSAVEYAVMLALLVIGCVVAFLLGGPSSAGATKPSTIAIKLRDDSDRTVRTAHTVQSGAAKSPSGAGRTGAKPPANTGAEGKSGNASAAVHSATGGDKAGTSGASMSAEDARQALLGLLKAYPGSFATSVERVQNASVVQGSGYVEIDRYRCSLQARTFEFGTISTEAGRSRGEISGFFYYDAKLGWTGTITRSARN